MTHPQTPVPVAGTAARPSAAVSRPPSSRSGTGFACPSTPLTQEPGRGAAVCNGMDAEMPPGQEMNA